MLEVIRVTALLINLARLFGVKKAVLQNLNKSKKVTPKQQPTKVVKNDDLSELEGLKDIVKNNISKLHKAKHPEFDTIRRCQDFAKSHLRKKLSDCDLEDLEFLRMTKDLVDKIMVQAKIK